MAATATSKTATAKAKAAEAAEAEATEATDETESDSKKRNRLRNDAERHILNLHKDEFDDYATELFAANGLTFNRRLSEAQKAEKKIEEMIAQHPELEDVLRAKFGVPAPQAAPPAGQESGPDEEPQVDYSAEMEGYEDPFEQR